jgi:DNA-binding CsgD family transcriptional regulator
MPARIRIVPLIKRTRLTNKQLETLQYVANGLTNKEIANIYNIGHQAIRSRLEGVYYKLEAENRSNAVAIGFRLGLIK